MPTITLKIKRRLLFPVWNNLKRIPPKDYPTTEEIKATISGILPAFEEHVGEYRKAIDKAIDVQNNIVNKSVTEEDGAKQIEEVNKDFAKYNEKFGSEVVSISLSEEDYKILKGQFEREGEVWGKVWFVNIAEFQEFSNALEAKGK